jgi:Protein of unknown function (DUF3224)
MHINAKGEFQVKGWDEKPYHEERSRKQTLAIVDQAFSGDVTGEGAALDRPLIGGTRLVGNQLLVTLSPGSRS